MAWSIALILWTPLARAHGFQKFPPLRKGMLTDIDEYDGFAEILQWDGSSKRPTEAGRERCPGPLNAKSFGSEPTSKFTELTPLEAGTTLKVELQFRNRHDGPHWWEFACFDEMEDKTANDPSIEWEELDLADGKEEVDCKVKQGMCTVEVSVPKTNCNHGILQWNWMDLQQQEGRVFKNCADVSIGGGSGVASSNEASSSESLSWIIPVILLALLLVAGVAYYVWRDRRKRQENPDAHKAALVTGNSRDRKHRDQTLTSGRNGSTKRRNPSNNKNSRSRTRRPRR